MIKRFQLNKLTHEFDMEHQYRDCLHNCYFFTACLHSFEVFDNGDVLHDKYPSKVFLRRCLWPANSFSGYETKEKDFPFPISPSSNKHWYMVEPDMTLVMQEKNTPDTKTIIETSYIWPWNDESQFWPVSHWPLFSSSVPWIIKIKK